jgi:putative flippase GtrA
MVPRNFAEFLAWSKTHQGKKLIRYTLSSVITTIFSQAVIFIVYGLRIIPGVIGATLCGNVSAVVPSYFLSRNWAWGKSGKSHWLKEVVPYWSMSLAGIAFSTIGAYVVKGLIHHHAWSHLIDTMAVAGMNLLSFAIFWVLKMVLFNKIFHTDKLHDIDVHLTAEEAHLGEGGL